MSTVTSELMAEVRRNAPLPVVPGSARHRDAE
jgi:hypothetical protein